MKRFSRNKDSGYKSNNKFRSDKPTMYDAICDECGKKCKVPFKPSGNKPVYCSSCFEKQGNVSSGRRDSRGSRNKEMFPAICDDCGKECLVPFKPSSNKPIYCSRCFEKRGNTHEGTGNSSQNALLEIINEKLDQVLMTLENKEN